MCSDGFFWELGEHRTSVIALLALMGGLSLSIPAYGQQPMLRISL